MTALKPAVTGDIGDSRVLTLNGVNTLASATAVVAHVWTDTRASVDLDGSVTDAANSEVTIELGGVGGWLPTATPDLYWFEVEVTFGSTATLTWPQDTPDTLLVREQGD